MNGRLVGTRLGVPECDATVIVPDFLGYLWACVAMFGPAWTEFEAGECALT